MSQISVIDREENGVVREIYQIVDNLVANYHPDLAEAGIVIAWCIGWPPEKFGTIRKAKGVEQQKGGYDLVITVNHKLWNNADFSERQRLFRMDELLSSIELAIDKNGDPKEDKNGRYIYRNRKPEFSGYYNVLRRYGMMTPEMHKLGKYFEDIFARGEKPNFVGEPDEVLGECATKDSK